MHTFLPTYRQLKGLGERFLGPVFAPAMVWLADRILDHPAPEVLFAAREGYFFRRLAMECRELLGKSDGKSYRYLEVSRTMLFRLVLADERLLPAALQHVYKGGLEDMLQHRFGLLPDEIEAYGLRTRNGPSFSLPDDWEIVAELILSNVKPERIVEQRKLYLEYFQELSPGDGSFHVVDIGYAGTIQKLLTGITDRASVGSYLIRTKSFTKPIADGCKSVEGRGYWADEAKFGDGDPLLEYSLIMEAIFTAPVGQLRSISSDGLGGRTFAYRPIISSQDHFYFLSAIVDGISECLKTYVSLIKMGADPTEIVNGRGVYDASIRYDRSPEMLFVKSLLHIDDTISGLGVHAPFSTFGIA